ncbi:MAG: universal stress protein [Bacteroidota bacterium]
MNNAKRWLVPLRLDESDNNFLAYVAFMASQIKPEYIRFLHVAEPENLPIGLGHYFSPTSRRSRDDQQLEMKLSVYNHFSSAWDMSFEIVDGKQVQAVLNETVAQEIDLTFLSWDGDHSANQTLTRKIFRKTCSSVCLVPKGFQPKLQSVLVPVDFSIYSHRALRLAMDLTKRGEVRSVYCQHVFLGANYYQEHLVYTVEEALEQARRVKKIESDLQRYFEDELSDYVSAFDLKSRYCLQQVDSLDHRRESVHDRILSFAQIVEPDLLIIGSRGMTGNNSAMLGGVTDNILRDFPGIPILCLKRQMENRDLLNSLLDR